MQNISRIIITFLSILSSTYAEERQFSDYERGVGYLEFYYNVNILEPMQVVALARAKQLGNDELVAKAKSSDPKVIKKVIHETINNVFSKEEIEEIGRFSKSKVAQKIIRDTRLSESVFKAMDITPDKLKLAELHK